MARRRSAEKREIEPDPVFGSILLAKFINKIMLEGKKTIARDIVYNALKKVAHKLNSDQPLELFEKALNNGRPLVEVKSRRIGGATYQVPMEIAEERSIAMAMRWIINHSRDRSGKPMEDKLAQEIMDCCNGQGTTVKKKDDTHRMAEANKAFAHYKW